MRQEGLIFRRPQIARMPAPVEFYIAPHPLQVGIFSTQRQVTSTHALPRHLEQPPPFRHIIGSVVLHDLTAIRLEGNQEDVWRSITIYPAFDAILRTLWSDNIASNKTLDLMFTPAVLQATLRRYYAKLAVAVGPPFVLLAFSLWVQEWILGFLKRAGLAGAWVLLSLIPVLFAFALLFTAVRIVQWNVLLRCPGCNKIIYPFRAWRIFRSQHCAKCGVAVLQSDGP
jgi:hypothetical protein